MIFHKRSGRIRIYSGGDLQVIAVSSASRVSEVVERIREKRDIIGAAMGVERFVGRRIGLFIP